VSGEETTAKTAITFRGDDYGRQYFKEKKQADTHLSPPRVTPTLVTPLRLSRHVEESFKMSIYRSGGE